MYLISQLAKLANLPVATIRFYEKSGLIKPTQINPKNKYAYYSQETVEKLELITDAKIAGFTIAEIKEVINAWYGKRLSVDKKIELLNKKLLQIESKIKDLQNIKSVIKQFKKEVIANNC
jgi:MerR family transcriptional regulator, copper efflux regulator